MVSPSSVEDNASLSPYIGTDTFKSYLFDFKKYQNYFSPVPIGDELNITFEDYLDKTIRALIKNNRNWIGVLTGQTGTGKSYAALKIASMIDPDFNADKIVFSSEDFLKIFPRCDKGEVILFDEGQDLNARRAMAESNVQMTKILGMLRFTQVNVIFTLPHIKMIDVNARRLMHSYIHTIDFDRSRSRGYKKTRTGIKWYWVKLNNNPNQKDSDDDIIYYFKWIKGKKIDKLWLNPPPTRLLDEYEEKKHNEFFSKLMEAQKKTGARGTSILSSEVRRRDTRDEDRRNRGDLDEQDETTRAIIAGHDHPDVENNSPPIDGS